MGEIVRIQLRRDTAANWTSNNPLLAEGEPGWEIDTYRGKVGDGVRLWNDLPYNDRTKVFTISVPSTRWYIQHNCRSFPSVTTVDTSNKKIEGSVNYINNNQVTIEFAVPFAGRAFINL